jgi:thiol:disulfide interchange protein DsbC
MSTRFLKSLLAGAAFCVFAATAFAQAATPAEETAAIKVSLETRFPKAKIGNIRKALVPGLYEATIDTDVVHVDAAGKFLLVGALYDVSTMTNLVEGRQNELFGFKWDELPLDKAIKVVRGKGSRRVAVFTDADCPYCKRLEQTFAQMDDVTIYNFLMPIDSLHPDAGRKSKIIWCSKDRTKSWLDFMLNNKLVEGKGDCPNPIDELKALGASKRVNGTPALVFPDNQSIPGAIPREQIEAAMAKAEAAVKAKKAS